VAVTVRPSEWLLVFSMFLFLSLALVKRHIELVNTSPPSQAVNDRGYRYEDRELLGALGVTSGYLAVLVACLYINSDAAQHFYQRPNLLWGACILLLYWISHMWLVAHRRMMNSDPVAFALRDPVSWLVFSLGAAFLIAAT
jgi:4-hydroxybenzoate polyprenyltransferase